VTTSAASPPTYELRIAVTEDGESTRRIVDGLQKKYPMAVVLKAPAEGISTKRRLVTVAVGPSALGSVLEKEADGTVISLFTSSHAYRAILQRIPKRRPFAVTAIYAEPSPFDQMRLISVLYKRAVNVAVLVSDQTTYLQPILSRAAIESGISLSIEHVGANDNLNRVLNRIDHASAILAIPDQSIYNEENIRNILTTAYRHNQAVIGFSTALVKAGALASTVSDTDDILTQFAELIDDYMASGRLPEPQFPKYFRVVVNDSVARALDIVIDDSARKLARRPAEGRK
jgi:hypothetical protein